jgi:hypothetical protein
MLNTLGNINHPDLALKIEQVVLTQITMDKLAIMVQVSHHNQAFLVQMNDFIFVLRTNDGVFETWSCNTIFSDELHDNNVIL